MTAHPLEFMQTDHRRTIFPLRTSLAYVQDGEALLREHIHRKILDKNQPEGFVAGEIAFARKDSYHLRRVFVLDPIATFFLYDFVHRNRDSFPKARASDRQSYGHAFERRKPVDAFADYHEFRRRKYELLQRHGLLAQLDIFNCFNSFYHHDVTSFITTVTNGEGGIQFGQFLRELNAGDSIACFPQGVYPAKVIGNSYLGFVEKSRKIKVPALLRFLDDIALFGKRLEEVEEQVLELQYVLDGHHLTLNDAKTTIVDRAFQFGERKLDAIKRSLIQKRETAKRDSIEEDEDTNDDEDEEVGLTDGEREYLTALIQRKNVAQEDVELALTLMTPDEEALELLLDPVLDNAPHLLRGLYRFVADVEDEGKLWNALKKRLTSTRSLPEYDLFWYSRMIIDYYTFDKDAADLLIRIYERAGASTVVKATILETEFLDHGFADLKEGALRGSSNLLLSAAAMVGLARLEKGKRNQVFKYVARQGAHAALLASIASKMGK